MTRRDTIIVAILINAGLLTVLFITALTTREEEWMDVKPQIAQAESQEQKVHIPSQTLPEIKKEEPVVMIPEKKEEKITHKLPEPAIAQKKEELSTPKPILRKPQKPEEKSSKEITVQKGDNLEKLAKRHNTSVQEIIRFNSLPNSFLRVGQILKIPEGNPQMVKKETNQKETVSVNAVQFYTVKVGDNPWTIAMKHHMKVSDLLKLNQLDEKKARKLKPGDKLRIR